MEIREEEGVARYNAERMREGRGEKELKGKVQIEAGWLTMLPQFLVDSTLLPVNSSEVHHLQPPSTYSTPLST